jgi:hypothetical protein
MSSINPVDVTITSLETFTAFDLVTGNFLFQLDELQSATLTQSQDTTDITGKGGRKLNTLKKNKAITISGTNGMVSAGLLALQTGSEFNHKVTPILWDEDIVVKDNAAATSYVAIGTTGNEIESIYVKNSDGTLGDKLTQGDTAATGVFTYDPTTKALAFSGVTDGTEVKVYYIRNIEADVLENPSDSYSGKCESYIDCFGEDKCGNVLRIQIHIFKTDFKGDFDLEMGDNQTVHAFEADALAGACGTDGQFFTYTVFGSNAEDAA